MYVLASHGVCAIENWRLEQKMKTIDEFICLLSVFTTAHYVRSEFVFAFKCIADTHTHTHSNEDILFPNGFTH